MVRGPWDAEAAHARCFMLHSRPSATFNAPCVRRASLACVHREAIPTIPAHRLLVSGWGLDALQTMRMRWFRLGRKAPLTRGWPHCRDCILAGQTQTVATVLRGEAVDQ